MQLDQNKATADNARIAEDDVQTLQEMGYTQELSRRMSGFSNLALSMSIICVLAGGITSFHLGVCSVGGASIGVGWPVVCAFSLIVALTMAQVASAFPTAGGLYHWAAILGGKGWGWATAWFNLVGLITVLAAINVGTYRFAKGAFLPQMPDDPMTQCLVVGAITFSQALLNHLGIRITTILIDFSGYWILIVSALLTIALLAATKSFEPERLVTFTNFSGLPSSEPVWPATSSVWWLFALGFLLPAYTITGFDASAHVSEETVRAAYNVPRGIVRSVLVSGIAGWIMLIAIVLAIPQMSAIPEQGANIFFWTMGTVLPWGIAQSLLAGIAIAQYFCGLATVTSASRMTYAFARDGGFSMSASRWLRHVSIRFQTPDIAIWTVATAAVLFTVYTPVYSTITAVCTIFLYISYVLPTAIGFFVFGRSWTRLGPWHLGRWYRPLAAVSVVGCIGLIVIGLQPPNEQAMWVVATSLIVLTVSWFAGVRRIFPGPPCNLGTLQQGAVGHAPHDKCVSSEENVPNSGNVSHEMPNSGSVTQSVTYNAPHDNPSADAVGKTNLQNKGLEACPSLLGAVRQRTPARILLDERGTSYSTSTFLELRRDHAAAVDAVQDEVDMLNDFGSEFVENRQLFAVQSEARDKREYLLHPNLGRRLSESARWDSSNRCAVGADLQIVIGDGLSALAVSRQVPRLLPLLEQAALDCSLRLGQVFFVRFCRVGIMNEIGELLDPAVVVLLIGERPGLATAESLSAYLAYRPRPGHTDAQRNLISNIHAHGVSAAAAAARIVRLADTMCRVQSSGVGIKEVVEQDGGRVDE